jgi:hypothetical protein
VLTHQFSLTYIIPTYELFKVLSFFDPKLSGINNFQATPCVTTVLVLFILVAFIAVQVVAKNMISKSMTGAGVQVHYTE